jgi:hypothetical protein
MDKNIEGLEKNEIKGSIDNSQNKENLEISSTGYGYESVPLQTKQEQNTKE